MKIKVPIQLVELEEGNFHILISALFADNFEAKWAIDTGASKTVFDINLDKFYITLSDEDTDELHSAGTNGNPIKTTVALLKPFSIGNLKIENQKVPLIDLTNINKLYQKTRNIQICGLLGGDFLKKHNAVIDYREKILRLSD